MNLSKFVPNAVSRRAARTVLETQKNSPALLFGVGIVGVVGTAVLASRATLKLDEHLEATQEKLTLAKELYQQDHGDYDAMDYKQDVTYIYIRSALSIGRLYAPAVGCAALTVGSLAGSHHILSKRNAGLAAAYTALDKTFKEYRGRVVESLGEEEDRKFMHPSKTITEKKIDEKGKETDVERTVLSDKGGSPYTFFFDEMCQNWSKEHMYNQVFLQCQQSYANQRLRARGHVFLNDVLDSLGLERTPAGAVTGWIWDGDGDNFIDFGVFRNDVFKSEQFVNGEERSIMLEFNVDGVIYDKI